MRFDLVAGQKLLDMLERKKRPIDVIPTPFGAWNQICGEEGGLEGLARKWNVVIGGVTGTGKSYLASMIMANAVLEGHLVGNLNMEMSEMAVATRYLAQLADLPQWRLDMGKGFSQEMWLKAKAVADRMYQETGAGMLTTDASVFTLDDVKRSYELLAKQGARLIAVDYAQLVTTNGTDGIAGRSEAVAYALRELTKMHDVTTITISQFNREEARKAGPPTMHGLMGGGFWEHAANQIWLIDHTLRQGFGRNDWGLFSGEYTQLLCDKNRHGPAKQALPVKRWFDSQRFEQYIPGTDPEDPFVLEAEVDLPEIEAHWSDFDDKDTHQQEEMFT